MVTRTRQEVKHNFKTGAQPTEFHYVELIDAAVNYIDDGLVVPSINEAIGFKANVNNMRVYSLYDEADVKWRCSLESSGFKGFGIEDNNGSSAFFIQDGDQNIGVNNAQPEAKLHIVNDSTQSVSFRVDDTGLNRSSRFVIKNDGDVGVGLDNPSARLDIEYSRVTDPIIRARASSSSDVDFILTTNGNIGLGVEEPTAKIEYKATAPSTTPVFSAKNDQDEMLINIASNGGLHVNTKESEIDQNISLNVAGNIRIADSSNHAERIDINENGAIAFHGKAEEVAKSVTINSKTVIKESLTLASGSSIKEFSTDNKLASASDEKIATEKAIKEYVDNELVKTLLPKGTIIMWSGLELNIPDGWAICDGENGTPDLKNKFVVGAGDEYTVNNKGGNKTVTLDVNNLPQHSHTGTTNFDGAHEHTGQTTARADNDDNDKPNNFITHPNTNYYRGEQSVTSTGSEHSHQFTTDNTGQGTEVDITPRFYAVYFIIKI